MIDRLAAERNKETAEHVELSTGKVRRTARWPGAAKRRANVRTSALIVCLLTAAIAPGYATEFRSGDSVSVEPGEVIDDDLFVAGNSVTIAGTVTGDILAAGQAVRITGPVGGSVMAAGQDVRVTGDVAGSVRVAGQTVTLGGDVGRNAAAAGQTLLVAETARVQRDLHVAGNIVDVDGVVGRNAGMAAAAGTVRGQIGEELRFEGDTLKLGPSARVGGNLLHRSSQPLEIASGAVISGETHQLPPRPRGPERQPWAPNVHRILPFLTLISFPTVLVFGVVGLALGPRLFLASANAVGRRSWWNALLGIVILLLGPAAVFAVMGTIVGLPIGLLAFIAWMTALLFSQVPVATSLGRFLVSRFTGSGVSPYLGLFVGLIALAALAWVPIIGIIIGVLTVLLGLGAYARAAKGIIVEMRRHPA